MTSKIIGNLKSIELLIESLTTATLLRVFKMAKNTNLESPQQTKLVQANGLKQSKLLKPDHQIVRFRRLIDNLSSC